MIDYGKLKQDIEDRFRGIDDAISKLRQLTQPEPKYKYAIGDKIWFLEDNEAKETVINQREGQRYILRDGYIHNGYIEAKYRESKLYPTKAELIEAQIAYWVNQREPRLMAVINKCPDCGADMADYAGLGLDNKWHTACSKRCGYYTTTSQVSNEFEGEIKGFNRAEPITEEYCEHSGVKLGKECKHETDGKKYDTIPTWPLTGGLEHRVQNKCIHCGEFYR